MFNDRMPIRISARTISAEIMNSIFNFVNNAITGKSSRRILFKKEYDDFAEDILSAIDKLISKGFSVVLVNSSKDIPVTYSHNIYVILGYTSSEYKKVLNRMLFSGCYIIIGDEAPEVDEKYIWRV